MTTCAVLALIGVSGLLLALLTLLGLLAWAASLPTARQQAAFQRFQDERRLQQLTFAAMARMLSEARRAQQSNQQQRG